MEDKDRYPIGQQDFKTLRERNALYVDKTHFIEKTIRSRTQYYFLALPRRFGKSLFLSTLRYFFEPDFIYIIELKYDSTPEQALRQIGDKEYALKLISDPRRIFRIGISFSSQKRRIEGWRIVEN